MRKFAFICGLVLAVNASAQSPVDQLPEWARQKWGVLAKARSLEVVTRVNPFVWRGDFNGDGRPDFALFVRASTSKKEGIAILMQGGSQPILAGAGVEIGNGGDDFSWLDLWSVVEPTQRPGADSLHVEKESSASALIEIKNGKAVWQQQGD